MEVHHVLVHPSAMHPRRPFRPVLLVAAALLLGPGAQATGRSPAGTPPPTSTSPASSAVTHPTGAQDVVLQVTVGGGFTLPEVTVSTVPRYTLLGDGTVIVPAEPPETFSSWPALTPLRRFTLSESEIGRVLARAETAGLLGRRTVDYGDMLAVGIADAPTTTVTLHAGGRRITHSAYALEATGGPGLSAARSAARRALADFVESLPRPADDRTSAYHAGEVAVYVGPHRGTPDGSAPVVWPLSTPLSTLAPPVGSGIVFGCAVISGRELETLRPVLAGATLHSRWVSGNDADSGEYSLVARSVLPGTQGCPEEF